jgi:hypothetical protein
VKISNVAELKRQIKDTIDPEICQEIINLAYSEDGSFADYMFMESDVFFDDVIANYAPMDIALIFFSGKDLDSRGSANPNREYFRFNKHNNVESTDYPEDILYDELLDDVVDFIIDHIEEFEYPESIQDIINDYLDMEE